MNFKMISILVLIALLVVFVVQNTGVVEIRFLAWKLGMSRALVMIFAVLIGVVIGWLWHGRSGGKP